MTTNVVRNLLEGRFSKAIEEGDIDEASRVATEQLIGVAGAKAGLGGAFRKTPPAPVPTPTAPVPTPTAPVPTPTAPVPTPTAPVPTPTAPVPTPTAPVPTPRLALPEPTRPSVIEAGTERLPERVTPVGEAVEITPKELRPPTEAPRVETPPPPIPAPEKPTIKPPEKELKEIRIIEGKEVPVFEQKAPPEPVPTPTPKVEAKSLEPPIVKPEVEKTPIIEPKPMMERIKEAAMPKEVKPEVKPAGEGKTAPEGASELPPPTPLPPTTLPVEFAFALIDLAKKSKNMAEYTAKVFSDKRLFERVKELTPKGNIGKTLKFYFDEAKKVKEEIPPPIVETKKPTEKVETKKPTEEKVAPPITEPKFEHQKRATSVKELEDNISIFSEKIRRKLEQIENIAKTGTIQPKEIRPEFSFRKEFGKPPPEEGLVSVKRIQEAKQDVVEFGEALKNFRAQSEAIADDLTTNQLKNLEKEFRIVWKRMQRLKAISSATLREWQKGVEQIKDISIKLGLVKDIKEKIPVFDRMFLSALRIIVPKRTKKLLEGGELLGLTLKRPIEELPEDLRPIKALIDYARLNLLPILSGLRDSITNSISISVELPTYLLQDAYSIAKKETPVATYSIVKTLQDFGKTSVSKRKFSELLPPSIEDRLGGEIREAGGTERFSTFTNLQFKSIPLEPVFGAAVKFKRAADIVTSRTMAYIDLVVSASKEANKKGLKGIEREKFIDSFIKLPSKEASDSAVSIGRFVTFKPPETGGVFEKPVLSNPFVVLLLETFLRWKFAFPKWMAQVFAGRPEEWVRIKENIKNKQDPMPDFMRVISRSATGIGGLYLVNQVLYDKVDFKSMEYVDDEGNRTRLSGVAPLPEALFLTASFRGDIEKAKAALPYTSLPFSGLVSGQPQGLLGNLLKSYFSLSKGEISNERFLRELEDILNNLIPGRALLSLLKVVIDPTLRKGIGKDVPIYSFILPPVIDLKTGKPLQPKQKISELIELPSSGGFSIPGAERKLTELEKELLNHRIALFRSLRTPVLDLVADVTEGMPSNLREKFEKKFGEKFEKEGNELINKDVWKNATKTQNDKNEPVEKRINAFNTKREAMMILINSLKNKTIQEIEKEKGVAVKKIDVPSEVKTLPKAIIEPKKKIFKKELTLPEPVPAGR